MTTQLLIAQPPIQVMPALAEAVGFNEAAVLQIVHYWLSPQVNQNFKDGCYWVENLAFHLESRFLFWDEDTIGYIIAQFEQSGILTVRHETPPNGPPIPYHTINYERLEQLGPASDHEIHEVSQVQDSAEDDAFEKANSNLRPAFRVIIHDKELNFFIMEINDARHFLKCDLTLEVQDAIVQKENPPDSREVICHFPGIDRREFRKFTRNDATLSRILMDTFQMKTMKQLLLFCLAHQAARLVLFIDDAQETDFKIYREFLIHRGQTTALEREEMEISTLVNHEVFETWMEFMALTDVKHQQILWREQKTNPVIRNYLRYGYQD